MISDCPERGNAVSDNSNTGRDYLVCRSLYYTYGQDASSPDASFALKNIDLTIGKGEFVAVVGRNSSGKSTLAKLFSLVIYPSLGELYIDGTEVGPDLDEEAALEIHRKVGMVFQNPDNQLVATLVEEDIAFGLENLGYPSEEIRRRVDLSLDAVGLSGYAGAEPSRLSGGQKQRVAIAGILAMMPECIIFDESTAMLDPGGRREIMKIMKTLKSQGITVINITHLMEEAAEADRVIVLDKGRIAADGTPHEIFSDTEMLTRLGILPPQCADVMNGLREAGFPVGAGITPEECADQISQTVIARG